MKELTFAVKDHLATALALLGAAGAVATMVSADFPIGADPEHMALFFFASVIPFAAEKIADALAS